MSISIVWWRAGAVAITQADIKDTRADGTICGFVASQFKEFDFSQWQKQFDEHFAQLKNSTALITRLSLKAMRQ